MAPRQFRAELVPPERPRYPSLADATLKALPAWLQLLGLADSTVAQDATVERLNFAEKGGEKTNG